MSAVYVGNYTALARTKFNDKIYVDTRDTSVSPHILMDGNWEPWITDAWVRSVLSRGHTQGAPVVVDVGANCGWYTLLACRHKAQVYAFEPNARLAALIGFSLAVNGYAAHVSDSAIAEAPGSGILQLDDYNQGAACLSEAPVHTIRKGLAVTVQALDDALPPDVKVDVLKLDIEGGEWAALRGATKVLERSPRIKMFIEHHEGDTVMLEYLVASGFRLHAFEPSGTLKPVGIQEAAAQPDAAMLFAAR